ncbi:MAG: hypothetical protein KHY44_15400 [Clostridiales bacterium]|jgi:hypothetical protein|nr:hypothetical protein [Clostridiales bacterium]
MNYTDKIRELLENKVYWDNTDVDENRLELIRDSFKTLTYKEKYIMKEIVKERIHNLSNIGKEKDDLKWAITNFISVMSVFLVVIKTLYENNKEFLQVLAVIITICIGVSVIIKRIDNYRINKRDKYNQDILKKLHIIKIALDTL